MRCPLGLQVRVADLVTELITIPALYSVAVAVALAVFPVLDAVLLAIFHNAFCDAAEATDFIHFELPFPYEKVPVT